MSDDDHYEAAQAFLARANNYDYDNPCVPVLLATAQVHATLALAAATASAHIGRLT